MSCLCPESCAGHVLALCCVSCWIVHCCNCETFGGGIETSCFGCGIGICGSDGFVLYLRFGFASCDRILWKSCCGNDFCVFYLWFCFGLWIGSVFVSWSVCCGWSLCFQSWRMKSVVSVSSSSCSGWCPRCLTSDDPLLAIKRYTVLLYHNSNSQSSAMSR